MTVKKEIYDKMCKRMLKKYGDGKDYDCKLTYKNNECPVLEKLLNECPTLDTYEEFNPE